MQWKALAIGINLAAASPVYATTLTVDRTSVHPGDTLEVVAKQFHEPVDLYFDTHYVSGAMTVPADALPGKHWISAVGRKTGAGAQTAITVNSDWPQANFDAAGTSNNNFETLLDPKTVKRLAPAWSADIASPIYGLSPVIANGVLYVGSADKHLYALDATTGAQLWAASTNGAIAAPAAVGNGSVYVGSADGRVYAFDAATGAPQWSVMTEGQIKTAPIVHGGMVYVSSYRDKLYGLNAKNGIVQWAHPDLAETVHPSASHGMVYARSQRGFAAYNAKTGEQIFEAISANSLNNIAVNDGRAYFCISSGAEAIDAVTGDFLWASQGGPCVTLAVRSGRVYYTGQAFLFRTDPHSAHIDYTAYEHGDLEIQPALANGVVYLGGAYNTVSAVKAEDGTLLWSAPDGQEGIPVVANGMLYFISGTYAAGFKVYAYAIDGGKNAAYRANAQPPSYATLHRP